MSPEPEFYIKPRDEKADQFLVLACDGVWDVMSNEDICNFITHRMKVHDNLETICNEVIDTCLYKVIFDRIFDFWKYDTFDNCYFFREAVII